MALANVHSPVVFNRNAIDCGLNSGEIVNIETLKWNTQAAFQGYLRPNYDEAKLEEMVQAIPGHSDARVIRDRIGIIRSLWTECYAATTSALKAKHENNYDEDRPPKMNHLERNHRQDLLEKTVKGVEWSSPTRCGPNFLNKLNGMYETGLLRFPHWEEHTTEEMERNG